MYVKKQQTEKAREAESDGRVLLRALPALALAAYFVIEPARIAADALAAARLWAVSVLPVMFPFFAVANYLRLTGACALLRFRRVSGAVGFAAAVSFMAGTPVGTKTVCALYRDNALSRRQAQILLSLCANAGPMFVSGTLGFAFFGSGKAAALLLAANYLSCFGAAAITAALLPAEKNRSGSPHAAKMTAVAAIPAAVTDAAAAVIRVGAYLILFAVIAGLVTFPLPPGSAAAAALSSFWELTGGEKLISAFFSQTPRGALTAAAAALGFSGMCIILQCADYINETDLSFKLFIFGKCVQTLLAAAAGAILSFCFF